MDRLEKRTKKAFIGKVIDLAGGHFKEDELNLLYDVVKYREQYSGLAKSYMINEKGKSPDGKYIRIISVTYTFLGDENHAFVREECNYVGIDGQTGSWKRDYRTAREMLSVIGKIFR